MHQPLQLFSKLPMVFTLWEKVGENQESLSLSMDCETEVMEGKAKV